MPLLLHGSRGAGYPGGAGQEEERRDGRLQELPGELHPRPPQGRKMMVMVMGIGMMMMMMMVLMMMMMMMMMMVVVMMTIMMMMMVVVMIFMLVV